jgi:hypothetical protein
MLADAVAVEGSPGLSRSRSLSSPREDWLLTLPVLHPSALAVSSTDSPSTWRRTTAALIRAGSAARAAISSGSTLSAEVAAARSGRSGVERSRRLNGRRSWSISPLTTVWRTRRLGEVDTDERGLHQILGQVRVARGERAREANEPGPVPAHERFELVITRRTHRFGFLMR